VTKHLIARIEIAGCISDAFVQDGVSRVEQQRLAYERLRGSE